MASELADTFMRTLQQTEQFRDIGPLVALFADDAESTNLARPEPLRGPDGTRQFWEDYLQAFGEVRSTFTAITEANGTAVLEWSSAGTLPNGHPVAYRGVSVLEVGGGQVRKFRTYYDSATFVTKAASV